MYVESNFLQTLSLPSTTIEHDLKPTAELLLRVAYHVTPNHVIGVGYWFVASGYKYHHPEGGDHFYSVEDYGNPFWVFYKYSFTSRHPIFSNLAVPATSPATSPGPGPARL